MFLTTLLFSLPLAHAASCCGGGVSVPALIAGDERATLGASVSQTQIDVDVDADGTWRGRGEAHETNETLRIDGARLLNDRWQIGGSLPLVRRARGGRDESGLGDLAVNLGFEALPDWDYNPWRPKGLVYAQLLLPTGKSVYDASDPDLLEARGRGYWTPSLGLLLTKALGPEDLSVSASVHHGLSRARRNNIGERQTLTPGWGGSMSVSAGYNWRRWRLGAGLEWMYEDPIEGRVANGRILGGAERVATVNVSMNLMIDVDWSLGASIADQTEFGRPNNTALGRAVSLNLQRRWAR